MNARTLAALAAVAALTAGAALYALVATRTAPPPEINGFVLDEARALDFELVDSDGRPFAPRDFAGKWSFLYFGFTHCPDVCPLSLLELSELKMLLAERVPDIAAQYLFVSVDPERDTPEKLREYVTYFDPEFRGLTGDPDAIASFARAVGAVYFVPPDQSAESYVVSHTSNVTLIDPDGRLHAVLTSPHTAESLAADFTKILDHYAASR